MHQLSTACGRGEDFCTLPIAIQSAPKVAFGSTEMALGSPSEGWDGPEVIRWLERA
jgi:hypothetical protein